VLTKRVWEPMKLGLVGHVGDVLQMPGGGKLSVPADDTGDEARQPKGQG
jgi:hypothetical protein